MGDEILFQGDVVINNLPDEEVKIPVCVVDVSEDGLGKAGTL